MIDIETLIAALEIQFEVEYAHGPIQTIPCSPILPNDFYFQNGDQWYLEDIDAPEAWSITKGDQSIKIAIIEPGGVPEHTHPDLSGKIDQSSGDPVPYDVHATRVAGFAGASTNNNGEGIASLAWNIGLFGYNYGPSDSLRQSLADDIYSAINDGASIINMSFTTTKKVADCGPIYGLKSNTRDEQYIINYDYDLVRDAVADAIAANVIVVASAGNDLVDDDYMWCESVPFPAYPAQYPGVIGVSASDINGDFVVGWNYGSNVVDVNAPGTEQWYDWNNHTGLITTAIGGYGRDSGTSYSSPIVAALAALMKSIDNTLTPQEIENILEISADKIGQYSYNNGYNQYMGHGRINAYKALFLAKGYGHITTDVTFYDDFELKGDVIVDEGVTLAIKPGVTVTFEANGNANGQGDWADLSKLIVRGKVILEGTPQNPMAFQSSSGVTGSWGGIRFEDQSDDNSVVKYSHIKDANIGIELYRASAHIVNNVIENNVWGLLLNYSNSVVQNNDIENNTSNGLMVWNSSSPVITTNILFQNAGYGIYGNNSSPVISGNTITENGLNGVEGINGFDATIGTLGTYENRIHNNYQRGVSVGDNSTPFLGNFRNPGNNHIHSNGSSSFTMPAGVYV